MIEFTKLCKRPESKLKKHCKRKLKGFGYEPVFEEGFLYAKGDIPILLTAHLDTVHEELVREITVEKHKDKTIISSPQGIGGDDRCGVYMILKILKAGYRPYILFCEEEEIGGIGSAKFCKSKYIKDIEELNYAIELDRANANDAVFYEDGNMEFHKYIERETGFKEDYGSFSDISNICPESGISGVNLSCGYYKAHTKQEYVVFEEMLNTIEKVKHLLDIADSKQFKYESVICNYNGYYGYGYGYGYAEQIYCEFIYLDEEGKETFGGSFGSTPEECVGIFLIEHPNMTWSQILDWYEC